ncbi:MAG: hypothetical protein E4G74_00390 [Erysipelotrichales bacterium]|nr:MAG: hypothetical protein E4G74_00390 [Erysipelotrichales bacterium]
MDNLNIFLPFIGIGLVYFFIIMFLKAKFHISYLKGVMLPLLIVGVFLVLLIYTNMNPQPGSWNDLVFAAMAAVSFVSLMTYLVAWGIVTLLHKKIT